jgi:hypothetical protein
LDKKKFNIDAMINGTTASRDNRRPFYAVRIGVMSMQSPSKIELQKDRNGLLITTPSRLRYGASLGGALVTPLKRSLIGKTRPTDESQVKKHIKSTNHLTNTITMVMEPLAPPAAWI